MNRPVSILQSLITLKSSYFSHFHPPLLGSFVHGQARYLRSSSGTIAKGGRRLEPGHRNTRKPSSGALYPANLDGQAASNSPSELKRTPNARPSQDPSILSHDAVVVVRQIEMMNIFLGFEQANRYRILSPLGQPLGFIAEEQGYLGRVIQRQMFRTHRSVSATVMDAEGRIAMKLYRPFSFINSKMFVYDADDNLIGEVHQIWHLWRRKYDLFVDRTQFARIDAPFLSWDFDIQGPTGEILGNVNRNFAGFAREIFTDTGQYVLRASSGLEQLGLPSPHRDLSAHERAVMMAAAIEIDIDYFSRLSSGGGFPMFPFLLIGGSEVI